MVDSGAEDGASDHILIGGQTGPVSCANRRQSCEAPDRAQPGTRTPRGAQPSADASLPRATAARTVDTTCRKILDRTPRRQVDPEMLRRVDGSGIGRGSGALGRRLRRLCRCRDRASGGGRGRVDRCQIRAPPAVVSTADAIERSAPRVWEDYPDNISFVYLKGDKAATDPRLRQSRAFGERFEVPSALGTSKRMNYGSPYPNHRTLPPRQLFTIHLRPAMSALKSLGFCSSQGPAGR